MDESEFDQDDLSYRMFRQRTPSIGITLPVIVLLVVVAVVSGLVFGGVLQGDETRVGPAQSPTTQSTIQVVP